MALLTAEDVLNKAFSKTKYREGFDQDEVDDFLDEVASTISALTAERDELAARLHAAPAVPAAADAAPASAPEGTGLLAAATDPVPPTPTGMLAMAQKLHDEYVHAGESERDRLVTEAKAKAESIVASAEEEAQASMDALNSERANLEGAIDDLRRFERDYRSRLRAYLENLLGDLDHGGGDDSTIPSVPDAAPYVEAPGDESPFDSSHGNEEDVAPAEVVESESFTSDDEDGPVFPPVNDDENVPPVAEAEPDESPYTPPSARMFSELYGQNVDEDNK